MSYFNDDLEAFQALLSEDEFKEVPVDLDTFLSDNYYLGNLRIKTISDIQRTIIEAVSQIYLYESLEKLYGKKEADRQWALTVHEVVALIGKGGGKDFSSRVGFVYAIYKLHCLRDPIEYYGKSHGTYIDMLNIAVNADQARNVFFEPLTNMLRLSPYFQDQGFEPRKNEIKFHNSPIRVHSGNSEAEAWEGLDLLLVVLDEIAAFKALPNSTLVLTPDGYVKNGDLRPGDFVIGQDGKPTRVEQVFPQGEREVFEVEFEDGVKSLCSDDHIWNVDEYSDGRRKSNKNLRLKDFKSIELKGKYNQKRYSIPIVEPVEFDSHIDLPIEPYILGILLAEGSLGQGAVRFSTGDRFVLDEVTRRLPEELSVSYYGRCDYGVVGRGNNPYRQALRDLNLAGTLSGTKFIPEIYLTASVEDRKSLLAGMLDGDGTKARGHGSYTTISDRLKDDIVELCRSLGGVPMVSKHKSWCVDQKTKQRKRSQDKWMVCPRMPFNPFLLPYKSEGWKPHKRTLWRSIVGVKSLGYEEEMTCIKVANNDGLYVIDGYVVTHNSDSALRAGTTQRLSASAIYKMSKLSVMSRFPSLGKVILLSFPRFAGDFIMQRYKESAEESHVLRIKASTYEANPMITREMLEPEYQRNPVEARSRFDCEPPEMVSAYFRDPQRVRRCFKGEWKTIDEGGKNERMVLKEREELIPIKADGSFKHWFQCSDNHTRFIHVDLGLKRDRAAICMTHSPGYRKIEVEMGNYEPLPVVKMDLIHYWEAQPGQEIDFAGIREFIKLLAVKFPVGLVTLDQWNSVDTIQILNRRGIRTETHSVKKNDYDTLSTAFYDGRFSGYFHNELVENELLKLQILPNGKVDHLADFHDDLSQALAGSVWSAIQYADLDNDIEISVLGDEDDWAALEYAEALEDDRQKDGRVRDHSTLTYEEDEADFDFVVI